ncbi:MAG TPA: hypothetical protein VLM79_11010, partial [Kofleriaceae bacterium]|nr:hypothetical protein [Kofleriaceae bacterium]
VHSDLGDARAALERALPPLLSAVELPLELARERAREWFRARFGEGVRVPALEVHRAFDGDRVLDVPAATPRAGALAAAIDRVRAAIDRAAGSSSGGQVRIDAEDLRGALAGLAVPAHAGYVSADVMLRRLPSGDAGLVLGEVHGFVWMPTNRLDIVPPDQRERVLAHMRAAVHDMACGKRTAEAVFLHTQATDRRFPLAATDLQLVVRTDRPGALDFGAVDVRLAGDDFEFLHGDEEIVPLVAYTRYPFLLYTSRVAPLYDDYAETFFPESLLPASLRGDAPRLALDDLVVRRRQWRRPAAQLHEQLSGSEAELFRRAQSLQRELGCDARVFASLRGQPKPVMIDFENVFLLEALRNMLENQPDGAVVKLTEMLPAPGELVATGPDGPRTSELRMGFYRLAAPASPGARQGSGSTAAIRSSAV